MKKIKIFTYRNFSKQYKKGFTVIELLVVFSVIILLAVIVWVSLSGALRKAKIGKAEAEVATIYKAIKMFQADNGYYPKINDINSVDDFKTYVAPYLTDITVDPWGNFYYYDGCPAPCQYCQGLGWDSGCEPGVWQTSICSGGPDGVVQSRDVPGPIGDDLCLYFAQD